MDCFHVCGMAWLIGMLSLLMCEGHTRTNPPMLEDVCITSELEMVQARCLSGTVVIIHTHTGFS
jgi:hypothetical protein